MFNRTFLVVLLALIVSVPACNIVANIATKPAVIIASPPSGSTFLAGEPVAIQSNSADPGGISRVELSVDGAIVRNDTPPSPQTNFTIIQTWTAQPGAHTISVRAYNTSGMPSDPAAISISVNSPGGIPPGSSSSAVSSIPPSSSSSAVSSIPPSSSSSAVSSIPPSSSSSAASSPPPSSSSSSASAPPASSSSSVAAKPDLFVSEYALNPSPPTQGSNVHVRIGVYNQGTAAVSTPFKVEWWAGSNYPAAACSWTVDSLAAKGGRILECDDADSWASWYANITTRVKVDPTNAVSESDEGNNIKDMNVQVQQAAVNKPDLFVSEYTLTPSIPTQGSNVHVRIGVYNQGTAAASTPFKVEWWAGSNYPAAACSWTVDSLAAKGGRILECDKSDAWASWYANITTRVKADPTNTVSESDEGNNIKDMNVQVKQPAPPGKPDVYVSAFSLVPNPPNHAANVHVSVSIYNSGTAATSVPFIVQWYAGSNYASPACSWTVNPPVNVNGGRVLECDKTNAWASNYSSITTRVKVDPTNVLSEGNEGNNIHDLVIKVN